MKKILLPLCAAIFLCSCQSTQPKTIGIAVFSMENSFAGNLCYEFRRDMAQRGVNVVFADANGDSHTQEDQLNAMIEDKVDLLVIMPVDSEKVDANIIKANEAGIPVFTFDTGCDTGNKGKVVSHIASDNYNAGRKGAQLMIRALNDKGKVIIVGTGSMEATEQRAKGFRDELNDRKSKIEIVSEVPVSGDAVTISRTVFEALKNHSDISGVFAVTDTAAAGAMRGGSMRELAVVGFGDLSFIENAVRSGKMYAGLGQSHVKLAGQAAVMIDEYLNQAEKLETAPTCILIDAEVVTADKLTGKADQ